MTSEEILEQLERVLQGRAFQGSESLKAFLRFVVTRAVEDPASQLKEYVIATEVFGRGSEYNSRIDSVVRVQASRLRAKLQDYYATEGRDDRILIDLPKGHYTPFFTYHENGGARVVAAPEAAAAEAATEGASSAMRRGRRINIALVLLSALAFTLALAVWKYQTAAVGRRAEEVFSEEVQRERRAAQPLWGELLSSPEPSLVVFSNTLFEGTAESGMKILKSLDAPGSTLGSAAIPQEEAARKGLPVTEHYTGVGEVMGVYSLGEFFARVKHPFRVKRSLLLTWDDLKSGNLIVLGSPAENLFLRDLPQKQELVFRPLKDARGRDTFGVLNTRPQPGEQREYLAQQGGPSRSQITEDYAVISLLRGLDASKRLLILAGITTLGTQAAAEYVSRPEYISELIARLNTARPNEEPLLPASFQVLVRVKVTGGVPVQISYLTHHTLQP